MKTIFILVVSVYIPALLGFDTWCQSPIKRADRPHTFSYMFVIKDSQGNNVAATRCYVALTDQEKQMLYNTLNMFSADTQLRSITTVKDSLLALFGQQVMKAKGDNATVQDALTYLE